MGREEGRWEKGMYERDLAINKESATGLGTESERIGTGSVGLEGKRRGRRSGAGPGVCVGVWPCGWWVWVWSGLVISNLGEMGLTVAERRSAEGGGADRIVEFNQSTFAPTIAQSQVPSLARLAHRPQAR